MATNWRELHKRRRKRLSGWANRISRFSYAGANSDRPQDLLYDWLALDTTFILLLAFMLHDPSIRSWESFVILYVPAYTGNIVSIPVWWKLAQHYHKKGLKPSHLWSSTLVHCVNWFFFVPATTWLASPWVDLDSVSSFHFIEFPKMVLYMVIAEFWFYTVHYVCHSYSFLYALMHKHHHRVNHPHVIDASYQHPMEMILITMGTYWVPFMIVNGHPISVGIHAFLITALGNFGHCGIDSVHDAHHRFPRGNYGFLGLADNLFGTKF